MPHYVIHWTLTSDKVPSGLHHPADGKCPDGITTIPWWNGKLLVWDATSPDTFAFSYVLRVASEEEAVAALAEDRKRTKYTHYKGFCGITWGHDGVSCNSLYKGLGYFNRLWSPQLHFFCVCDI